MFRRGIVVAVLAAVTVAAPAGAGEREHVGRYSTPEMVDVVAWVPSALVVVIPAPSPEPADIVTPEPAPVADLPRPGTPPPAPEQWRALDALPAVGPRPTHAGWPQTEVVIEPDWNAGPIATDPSWLWDGSGQTAGPVPWSDPFVG